MTDDERYESGRTRALGSGCTKTEIEEVMLQMSAFGGFPAAWDALAVLGTKRDGSTGRQP